MITRNYILLIIILIIPGLAISAEKIQDKYCDANVSNSDPIDIHLFSHTYTDESQRIEMFQHLEQLYTALKAGQRLRIYKHERGAYRIAIDQCYPGCVDRGFISGLFDSSCSEIVTRRDKSILNSKLRLIIAEGLKQTNARYDILEEVQSLVNFYEANTRKTNVYAALSFMPYGVKSGDRSALNSLYTAWVTQSKMLVPAKFPPITVLGCARDKDILDFWKDLFMIAKRIEFKPICYTPN